MDIIFTLLLFLGVPFVLGLIFFLRSLILRKNRGCGLLGLLAMIPLIFVIWYLEYGINYQSKSGFIQHFEWSLNLTYPRSGKIIEKTYKEFLNYKGDYHCAAIIEMDTLDYEKLLHEVQSRGLADYVKESSFLLKKRFPADDCAYFFSVGKRSLWFHKNRRIVVYEIIDY